MLVDKTVIVLESAKNRKIDSAGSKAFNLSRLIQMGFNVPKGFCITTKAFEQHLEKYNTTIQIKLAELTNSVPKQQKHILYDIRKTIIETPVDDCLRQQIESHYRKLNAVSVAVRSSATAEDTPEHSFAGQYDTFLDIKNLDECIEAIKKCWASVWTERAYKYRVKNNIDHSNVKMGVIVQKLVSADVSGIVFTEDPVNGYTSRIIIEVVRGLGESLVSGKTIPKRFEIDKKKLRIILPVDYKDKIKEQPSDFLIEQNLLKKLAKTARKIEARLGYPQDIEWSILENKIYFLQARAITGIKPLRPWQERQILTNANAGEVIPDVVTPLTWSVMGPALDTIVNQVFTLNCIERGEHQLFDMAFGRVYININTGAGILRCLPFIRNLDFHTIFGGKQTEMTALGQLDLHDEDIPTLKFNLTRMILKIPIIFFRILTYPSKEADIFLEEFNNILTKLKGLNIAGMDEKELAESVAADIRSFNQILATKRLRICIIYMFLGYSSMKILDIVCNRWFGDEGASLANRLLAGLGNMDDAEAGFDLWRLAEKAHENPEVENLILAGEDWFSIREKMNQTPDGVQFLKEWEIFMARHGHHCRGEIEAFNARWSEMPDYILSIVRNCISGIEQFKPLENYNRYVKDREELTKQYRKRLKNPFKRAIFNYLIKRSRELCIGRENSKSDLARIIAIWRKIFLELGEKLSRRGILTDIEDIFFLRFEEFEPVIKGEADFDVKETIASRRKEYAKNNSFTPPKVITGKLESTCYTVEEPETCRKLLNGLSVSSGTATGKARVILRTDTDQYVLPGEILVAPFTDPGWTPYFVPAAGIVMDQGGLLSHGSIIAREYGIPAVVNVGDATRIIKTGQTIRVDADKGIVTILD